MNSRITILGPLCFAIATFFLISCTSGGQNFEIERTAIVTVPVPTASSVLQTQAKHEGTTSIADASPDFRRLPAKTKNHTVVGILVDYAVGADAGGFDVKTSNGKMINFVVWNNMIINGALIQCTAPTHNCPNWPSSIVLGTSQVKVTYWEALNLNGDAVKASSQIDLVTP